MSREDAEFSPKTRREIAEAVSWHCSAPLCKNPAMGNGDGLTINGGTACHIYSAAKDGPRGHGGLTEGDLSKASNGLWCCAYHGRIIDSNQGKFFSAAQLHMWKRLAEGRVRRAMAVEFPQLGWVDKVSLSVATQAGGKWTVSASLQKNNFLTGPTGVGKSLLLEALASVSDGRNAHRLRKFPRFSVDLFYETLVAETVARVSCRKGESLHRSLSGIESPLPPSDISILFLNPERDQYVRDPTGVGTLKSQLDVDEDVLRSLASVVSASPGSGMEIEFRAIPPEELEEGEEQNEGASEVRVRIGERGPSITFNGLSGGEKARVLLALRIALARAMVKSHPVLLCVDALGRLDDLAFRSELARLAEEHIQLVVVTPRAMTREEVDNEFPGWNLLELPSIEPALVGEISP